MNHEALVRQLAPVAFPCFADRISWLEYCVSAAAYNREDHGHGPLLFRPGETVIFNRRFVPCIDCTAQHSLAMTIAGRCDPDHLVNLIPAEAASATT